MRAFVADSSAPGRIALQDVPEPVAAPGEVLVDVRAFSINRGELGLLRRKPDGWRPGWDFAGTLQVDIEGGLRAGARVVGIRQGGTWAERVAVASVSIAELPDAVSFAQGAALPTAGLAALRMLRMGPAILGRRVLITGASGGVGRFAIQLAHLGGADVTALVSEGSARSQGLRDLGADEVVADIAQLRGRFDLILESVGGATLGRLVTMVDPDGTLVMFGNSSDRADHVRRPGRLQRWPRPPPGIRAVLRRRTVRSGPSVPGDARGRGQARSAARRGIAVGGDRARPCSGCRTATSPASSPSRSANPRVERQSTYCSGVTTKSSGSFTPVEWFGQ